MVEPSALNAHAFCGFEGASLRFAPYESLGEALMIVSCPTCGQKNRLREDIRSAGIYCCPACRATLVEIESTFHHKFLFRAVAELQSVERDIDAIDVAYFSQGDIDILQARARRANSRLELWKNNAAHLSPEERTKINRSYSLVLMEAADLFMRIEEAVEKKRVYKGFVAFLTQVQAVLAPAIDILNLVLPWFGLGPIKFATRLLSNRS